MDMVLGFIYIFGGNYAPESFAICQGQLLTTQQYTALFSIVGTQYGGDGRTNFQLPNLMGRVPVGYGQNPGNGEVFNMGRSADNLLWLSLSINNLPTHTHMATASASYNGHSSLDATGTVTGNYSWSIPASTSAAGTDTPTSGTSLAKSLTKSGMTTGVANIYTTSAPDTAMPGGSGTLTGTTTVTVTAPQVAVANAATGVGQSFFIMPSFCTVNYIICINNGYYPSRS